MSREKGPRRPKRGSRARGNKKVDASKLINVCEKLKNTQEIAEQDKEKIIQSFKKVKEDLEDKLPKVNMEEVGKRGFYSTGYAQKEIAEFVVNMLESDSYDSDKHKKNLNTASEELKRLISEPPREKSFKTTGMTRGGRSKESTPPLMDFYDFGEEAAKDLPEKLNSTLDNFVDRRKDGEKIEDEDLKLLENMEKELIKKRKELNIGKLKEKDGNEMANAIDVALISVGNLKLKTQNHKGKELPLEITESVAFIRGLTNFDHEKEAKAKAENIDSGPFIKTRPEIIDDADGIRFKSY